MFPGSLRHKRIKNSKDLMPVTVTVPQKSKGPSWGSEVGEPQLMTLCAHVSTDTRRRAELHSKGLMSLVGSES